MASPKILNENPVEDVVNPNVRSESSSEEMSDANVVGDSSVDEPVDEVLSDEADESMLSGSVTPSCSMVSPEIGSIRSRPVFVVPTRMTTPTDYDSADFTF